jgi:hypothetical protein
VIGLSTAISQFTFALAPSLLEWYGTAQVATARFSVFA